MGEEKKEQPLSAHMPYVLIGSLFMITGLIIGIVALQKHNDDDISDDDFYAMIGGAGAAVVFSIVVFSYYAWLIHTQFKSHHERKLESHIFIIICAIALASIGLVLIAMGQVRYSNDDIGHSDYIGMLVGGFGFLFITFILVIYYYYHYIRKQVGK